MSALPLLVLCTGLAASAAPQPGATKGRLPVAATFAAGTESVVVQLHVDLRGAGLTPAEQVAVARTLRHAHHRTRPIFPTPPRAELADQLLSLHLEAPPAELQNTLKALNALLAFRLRLDPAPASVALDRGPALEGAVPADLRELTARVLTQDRVMVFVQGPLPAARALALAYRALPTRLPPGAPPAPAASGPHVPLAAGPDRVRTIAAAWLAAEMLGARAQLGPARIDLTAPAAFAGQAPAARDTVLLARAKTLAQGPPAPDALFETVARAQNRLARRWQDPVALGRDIARAQWRAQDVTLFTVVDDLWPRLSPEDVRRGAELIQAGAAP